MSRGLPEHGEISPLALRPAPGQPHPTAALTRQASRHQLAAFLAAPGSCKPKASASWMLLCSSHTAHGEGRWMSGGREACSSGRHPHPLPQWAARSQGSLLQGSAAVITSGVNHQRLQACTRLLTFSTAQSCSALSPARGRVPGQWRSWQQHPGACSKPEAPTSPILHRGETLLGFGVPWFAQSQQSPHESPGSGLGTAAAASDQICSSSSAGAAGEERLFVWYS